MDDVSHEDEYRLQQDASADMMVDEVLDCAGWKRIALSWCTVKFFLFDILLSAEIFGALPNLFRQHILLYVALFARDGEIK